MAGLGRSTRPPWIIWVEDIPSSRSLYLIVYRPRRLFPKWPREVRIEGPILYDSPSLQAEYVETLVGMGEEVIPPNTAYKVAYSLPEVQDLLGIGH